MAGTADITCLFQLLDDLGQPLPLTTPAISLGVDIATTNPPSAEANRLPAEAPQSDPPPTEMPAPAATVEAPVSVGHVTGMLAPPLPLAEMTMIVAGAEVYVVAIGADGSFSVDLPYGSYELVATISGYPPLMRELTVDAPALVLAPLTDADFGSYAPPVDVNVIIEHFGQPVPPAPPAADVNGDGRVDIYDLVRAGRGAGS
ncbi:MAG: hypothetical protein IT320_16755 [Anaerolineae bacterium]|nr:hypothetical protein [Anaerolineae bacterium]